MTAIEWTKRPGTKGESWNPIRARHRLTGKLGWWCVRVSSGCEHCYACGMNAWRGNGVDYAAQHRDQLDIFLDDRVLFRPVGWAKPRTVFVCSMTDLFGEWVDEDWIDDIFDIIEATPRHTYLILTKRAPIMRRYLGRRYPTSPPAHVEVGISVENQRFADARREGLKAVAQAGWKTFVSYEPALGPVDWRGWEFVRQIISGGESGPGARVHHPDWHRATRDWCQARGIAYFFKQWGEWLPGGQAGHIDNGELSQFKVTTIESGARVAFVFKAGKKRAGALLDGREWREFPKEATDAP